MSKIRSIKSDKPYFILVEGVLFFLNREETDNLFDFNTIQDRGAYIISASFQETLKETFAFKNLIHFFNKKDTKTTESDYQTIRLFQPSEKYRNEIKQPKELNF